MADNPFDPKPIGLLGLLGAEARPKSLLDYIGTPAPTLSPAARTIVNLLTDASTPANSANALSSALGLRKVVRVECSRWNIIIRTAFISKSAAFGLRLRPSQSHLRLLSAQYFDTSADTGAVRAAPET